MSTHWDDPLIEQARGQAARWRARRSEQRASDAGSAGGPSTAATTAIGQALPRYELLGEIHRGGQGVVYRAMQRATQRIVAIKIMREGPFASDGDRARFDREVRILASLRHPNIVAIHDCGEAAGCFYFVMDFIEGQSLDHFVRERQLSVRETLALVAGVCEAVEAAHLRGIIHRDLKPGNIRVDVGGSPHVLDFGLAKVATGDGSQAGMTQTGQFVGSLPWASPEAAEGRHDQVDVRSDVYSLGVITFGLLTQRFPYPVTGALRDVMEAIAHREPLRASELRREIDHEADTIVRTCLQKDPERRYRSAGDLGRDIRRYLAGEPIDAKRDSTMYMVRKALRRYRVPVAAVSAFVVMLAVAAGVLWVMYNEQLRLRQRADEQKGIALREKAIAQRNAGDARRRLAIARDTAEFVMSESARELTRISGASAARERLVRAGYTRFSALLAESADDDATARFDRAEAHLKLANIAQLLNDSAAAVGHCRVAAELARALVAESPDHGGCVDQLANALLRVSDVATDRAEVRQALEEQLPVAERLAALRPNSASGLIRLISGLQRSRLLAESEGRLADCARLAQRATDVAEIGVKLSPASPDAIYTLAATYERLARARHLNGQPTDAVAAMQKALDIREQQAAEAPNDQSRAVALYNALDAAAALEREQHATRGTATTQPSRERELLERSRVAANRLVGLAPQHPLYQQNVARANELLARMAVAEGRLVDARQLLLKQTEVLRALARAEPTIVVKQQELIIALSQYADVELLRGENASAGRLLIEAAELGRQHTPETPARTDQGERSKAALGTLDQRLATIIDRLRGAGNEDDAREFDLARAAHR